jgi:hypothetical protein
MIELQQPEEPAYIYIKTTTRRMIAVTSYQSQ